MPFQTDIPLIHQTIQHNDKIAIVDEKGSYSYNALLLASQAMASLLLDDQSDLQEARVAFLMPSQFDYVYTQWGIWLAGGIAVPLCQAHPVSEMEYVLENSEASVVIAHRSYEAKLRPLAEKLKLRFIRLTDLPNTPSQTLPQIKPERRAMIIYTSGTTNKPKGAVTTHEIIASQIQCLVDAWEWRDNDYILHVLPLHHVHGIINVLCCALWAGATCEMLAKFDANRVWGHFKTGKSTLFMAVPTIYVKLLKAWESATSDEQQILSQSCHSMRLMVSGSAALPVSVFNKWKAITNHIFLERYGMTEIGMAIGNPLHEERRPGSIGKPFPGVTVRLVDENNQEIKIENQAGEIQVKGKNIFLEYWRNPLATQTAFKDGWFCTGDTAILENGYYRILGRNSVDIIKSGGYKISALEIEEALRRHPCIAECSVVGITDDEWGERVSAALVLHPNATLTLSELREWGRDQLAVYKLPSDFQIVEDLPRNVMGKVLKPEVKKLFSTD